MPSTDVGFAARLATPKLQRAFGVGRKQNGKPLANPTWPAVLARGRTVTTEDTGQWRYHPIVSDEPTQETRPKKGDPVTIPVPEKSDVMAALRKVAKADSDTEIDDLDKRHH